MSEPAQEIERVATLLGCDYMRSIDLSEQNLSTHYNSFVNALIIFNGVPTISTTFDGAEGIDVFDTEIYFLLLKDSIDQDASATDVQLNKAKEIANSFYFNLNVIRPIEGYELEGVEVSNDVLIGYKMTISLPFNSNVCTNT